AAYYCKGTDQSAIGAVGPGTGTGTGIGTGTGTGTDPYSGIGTSPCLGSNGRSTATIGTD
ncbi:hypothetical protein KI387_011106, partial [Taxus chinensis]